MISDNMRPLSRYVILYSVLTLITALVVHFGSNQVLKYMNSTVEYPQRFKELQALNSLTSTEFEELKQLTLGIVNDKEASSKRFNAYMQGYIVLTLLYSIFSFFFWYLFKLKGHLAITGIVIFLVVLITSGGALLACLWSVLGVFIHYITHNVNKGTDGFNSNSA